MRFALKTPFDSVNGDSSVLNLLPAITGLKESDIKNSSARKPLLQAESPAAGLTSTQNVEKGFVSESFLAEWDFSMPDNHDQVSLDQEPPRKTQPEQIQPGVDLQDMIMTSNLLNRSDYEDPITYQIMSDPVTCQDGHTYDRTVIERCFGDRIKAEKERQNRNAEERKDAADEAGADCCASQRRPLELLSPLTNEEVSGILVPNFILEQQIVRLMEVNAFQLAPKEIEDWEQGRREKKIRDHQRQEWERRQRAEQGQMRKNAEEAERRNQERRPDDNLDAVNEPTFQIRFDSNNKTGLAVALAQRGMQIPIEFLTSSGSMPRCMVDRCAKRLDDGAGAVINEWCARCARIVCGDCLAFEVSDINVETTSDICKICVDCVTQLVDEIEMSPDIRLQQRRVWLLRMLETHATRFSNRLAQLQEQLSRFEARILHSPKLKEMENEIAQLEKSLANFQDLAARASARVVAAQSDKSGRDVDEIARLTAECKKMENELMQLEGSHPSESEDEDAIVRYFESLSALTYNLEIVKTELAMALSKNPGSEEGFDSKVEEVCESDDVRSLEQKCLQLERQYAKLSSSVASDADMELALEMSSVESKLEESYTSLAMARSVSMSRSSTNRSLTGLSVSNILLPHTTHFIDAAAKAHCDPQAKRKTWKLPGKKKIQVTAFVRDWLDSMIQIKNDVLETIPSDVRTHKVKELLAQLSKAPELFAVEQCDKFGLQNARLELEKLISPSSVNRADEQFPINTDQSDIFWDSMAEFISMPNNGPSKSANFPNSTSDFACASTLTGFPRTMETIDSGVCHDSNIKYIEDMRLDLNAIGTRYDEWPLPHNLKYPTSRMARQLELLRNTLELCKVDSERKVEGEWAELFQRLQLRKEELEDYVARAKQNAASAEESARDEERRQHERAEQQRQREVARRKQEQILREKAERAERKRQELIRRHQQEEAATKLAFSRATGSENRGAERFGGKGDLRMCRRCRAGPIENQACSDLKAHNDTSTMYKDHQVYAKSKPNHCPHCDWFSANWHEWPYWDGVYGPH